jgi:hypothetical protein
MSALSRTSEWVRGVAAAVDAAHAIQHGLPVSGWARRRVADTKSAPRPSSPQTTQQSECEPIRTRGVDAGRSGQLIP